MKTIQDIFKSSALAGLFFLAGGTGMQKAQAQDRWSRIEKDLEVATSVDTTSKGKYTLVFIDKSPDLDPTVKKRLTEVFFINYPKEAKLYNKNTTPKVIFVVDPEYTGVAAAGGGVVRFNPEWFKKHPGDVDVVTHEVMHLVQSYPNGAGPGWVTEGVADYVRYKLGVDNEGADWKLTDFNEKQSYENSYRITARFFHWLESRKKGTVKKLDAAMRNKTYSDSFWTEQFGKDVDALWAEYAENPTVKI